MTPAITVVTTRSRAVGPNGYSSLCDAAADGTRQVGGFDDPQRWRFDWQRTYTREQWLDLLPTQGGHHQVPPAQLDELLAGIGAVIDSMGGGFPMRYATVAVVAARTDARRR